MRSTLIALFMVLASLAAAQTAAPTPSFVLPVGVAAFGEFNQLGTPRLTMGISAIYPVAGQAGVYGTTTADLLPKKAVDPATGKSFYALSASVRQGVHKSLYSSGAFTALLGGDVGPSFSSQAPQNGFNVSLSTSFVATVVCQLKPQLSFIMPIRMLYMTNIIRGLGFTFVGAGAGTGPEYYYTLGNYSTLLSEKPYASGSVFNFFPPNYVIPGSTTNAPEFSIENTASSILRLTLADNIVYNRISDFSVDLSATSALGIMASATGNATTDSTNLVNALGNIFMHGQMPAQMQTDIINHVATLSNIPERVRVATYLVITSSHYKVEH